MDDSDDFGRAMQDEGAAVAASFIGDVLLVRSDPHASDARVAWAFLQVAAAMAERAGMSPDDFARSARRQLANRAATTRRAPWRNAN